MTTMAQAHRSVVRLFSVTVICFLLVVTSAAATYPQKDAIAKFYSLRERTLDQRGSRADVDQLLALFAVNARYEHPVVGVVMTLEQARSGMLAHLKEGANATYRIHRARLNKTFAVVEATLEY